MAFIKKVPPLMCPEYTQQEEQRILKLKKDEIHEKIDSRLKELKGSRFISFFMKGDKKKLQKNLLFLLRLPYSHFEEWGHRYPQNNLKMN